MIISLGLSTMTQALLIEIGVEELPAIPLLKIVSNIEKSWKNITSLLVTLSLSILLEDLF